MVEVWEKSEPPQFQKVDPQLYFCFLDLFFCLSFGSSDAFVVVKLKADAS